MDAEDLQMSPTTEMEAILKRIDCGSAFFILLRDGKLCRINYTMLERMNSGQRYLTSDWVTLLSLLVSSKASDVNVFVMKGNKTPATRPGETFYLIRKTAMSDEKGDGWSWCITVCKPSNNTVHTYSVGTAACERDLLPLVTTVFGVEKHQIISTHQQETDSDTTQHVPFSDAILLDMLLDIITEDFVPNQRCIEDGKAFQLEILQALEKAQAEAAVAQASMRNSATSATAGTAAASEKKRVSIEDRLQTKKIKIEL
ncbi:hypothetical protein N0V94_006801 [Neodidymelliopsis sp. IMI 364377]|nr:hypothetical protein N0V94_006801 [Neodidymelliopsis sp. IMI 364377]